MNPFARQQNPSNVELIKMFLGLFTLVPLRLVLFLLTTCLGACVVLFCHTVQWHSLAIYGLRVTCRTMLFCVGYHYIPFHGRLPTHNRPSIVVCNHLSFVEVLHLTYLLGGHKGVCFVAKQSIFNTPLIGRIAQDVLNCIGVNRDALPSSSVQTSSQTSSQTSVQTANMTSTQQILERVQRQQTTTTSDPSGPLILFPEGTTSNGVHLLTFKTGAFVPLRPVLPILYSFPRSGSFVPTYESIWTPIYVWRTLCQPWNNLTCVALDPIAPTAANTTPREYATTVQRTMAKHLGIDTIPQGYKDKLVYHDRLRAQYKSHPRGAIYAMVFEPMGRSGIQEKER